MREIWRQPFEKYQSCLQKYKICSAEELFLLCKNDINKLNEQVFKTEHHCLTILETIGCRHQIREDSISGCTFCNWDCERIEEIARLKSLQQKDKNLYAQIISYSFESIRGTVCKPEFIEQISVHNILDEEQFPDEAYDMIFGDTSTYISKPQLGIISARADTVNADKVEKWKKAFRRNLTIGLGVEVGNEWLRNNWLNKNITNEQLQVAIDCIHDKNVSVCANIILGIPGLDDYNSLKVFHDTCQFCFNIGADYILISPLITKTQTLGALLGERETISEQLFWQAVLHIKQYFEPYLKRLTFSPDNMKTMVSFHGDQWQKKYESIGILNKVYASPELFHPERLNENTSPLFQKSLIKENLWDSAKAASNLIWGENRTMLDGFKAELERFAEGSIQWIQ